VAQGTWGHVSQLHHVVGHERLRNSLARAHLAGTLPTQLLLHGPAGIGKQRVGLWLAQLILCERPTDSGPCGACRQCRLAVRLEHPDLHWYFPLPRPKASSPDRLMDALEELRQQTLEEIRTSPLRAAEVDAPTGLYLAVARGIRQRAQKKPSMGATQVFLIGDADTLVPQESSPEAANALLKLLEEPPAGTVFILTSSEPHGLLPTIRSRTRPVLLAPLPVATVEAFLVEVAGATEGEARAAARLGRGSIGRSLGFLSMDGETGPRERTRRQALDLLRSCLDPDPSAPYGGGLEYPPARARSLLPLFDELTVWLRDLAAASAGCSEEIVNRDERAFLEERAGRLGLEADEIAVAVYRVQEARILAHANVNPQLLVFTMLNGIQRDLQGADL
jgi:DNA polymerase-3 subunit delta'